MYVQFITEDNQELCFTNYGMTPKIGDKLKFQLLKNIYEIIEYEVVSILYHVDKPSAWVGGHNPMIDKAIVTLKQI